MAGFSEIRALLFLMVIVVVVAFVRPRLQDDRFSWSVIGFFIVATSIGFLATIGPLFFAGYMIAALVFAARRPMGLKFPAFLAAVPSGMSWMIPLPGFQQLFTLTPETALGILSIRSAFKRAPRVYRDPLAPVVVVLFLVMWLLGARATDLTFTNWLRGGLVDALGLLIPYFAVRNGFDDKGNFAAGMKGFLTFLIVLAAVGFWIRIRSWIFYAEMPLLSSEVYGPGVFRGGALRASGTVISSMFSFLVLVGALLLWVFRNSVRSRPFLYAWLVALVLIAPLSASRGGLLGGLVAIGAYFVFSLRSAAMRRAIYVGSGLAALALFVSINAIDWSAFDPYGTFEYRQRLLEAGWVKFQTAPLIGDENYREDPFFLPLIQGEGIIDFVNTYIQFALRYGLLGFIPFLLMFAIPILACLKASRLIAPDAFGPDVDAGALGRAVAALLLGFAVVIFTTSPVGYVMPFIFVFPAIGMGYARVARR